MAVVGVLLMSFMYIVGGTVVASMFRADGEEPSLMIAMFWPGFLILLVLSLIGYLAWIMLDKFIKSEE